MNAASEHAAEARIFLEWVGSEGFANIYANALPGFFSLSSFDVPMAGKRLQDGLASRYEPQK